MCLSDASETRQKTAWTYYRGMNAKLDIPPSRDMVIVDVSDPIVGVVARPALVPL